VEIEEIISELKKLDLSTYPEKEIRSLLGKIGIMASMVVMYNRGKSVMRARPHNEDERFKLKSDLSYKPQKFNTTYQRASTPYETMFYATAIPDKIEPDELDNMRVIGIAETIPMMRDLKKSGYQKVSFGRWYAKETLTLLAIVHKDSYSKESSFTKELVEAFHEASKNAPKEVVEKSLKIQTYLAEEFSKEHLRGDYDYMISAIFTQIAVSKGYDGFFFPSVRVGGRGFNIAITPEATKKLGLYVAGECSVYKVKDHTILGNDAILELDGEQEEFELPEIPNNQQLILNKLGFKTLEELKNLAKE
jgi:hypothetical protein